LVNNFTNINERSSEQKKNVYDKCGGFKQAAYIELKYYVVIKDTVLALNSLCVFVDTCRQAN